MRQVFLDYQSSTPVLPEVFGAMRPFFSEAFGNPSSLHHHGFAARNALAKAREQCAALLHAESPEEILFTSGGTESANLAVKGAAYASQRRGNHIVVSAIEHPSVLNSVDFLQKQGFSATRVPVDREGFVDPEAIRSALTEQTILICVHHANHDIGTIEPIREIGAIAAERGIPLFVDAVASAGWLPVDVQALGASLLSLSPHRFYGPKGVGVLYRNRRARVASLIHGGNQEDGRRAGTENVPAIVGAGVAAEVAQRELATRAAPVSRLQEYLWKSLQSQVEYIHLNGPAVGARRLPTSLNVSFVGVEGEGLLLSLDMAGVAIASGTGCISKSMRMPHVLEAIGLDPALAQGSVLISLGKETTEDEIDYAVRAIAKTVAKLREMSPTWEQAEHRREKKTNQAF